MNIPLPRLLLLQLRVFDHRDVVRDLHADVITPEEYANYVELPGIIGGGPSKNHFVQVLARLYMLAKQYVPEAYAPLSPRTAHNAFAG